jgi:hypothetical protein
MPKDVHKESYSIQFIHNTEIHFFNLNLINESVYIHNTRFLKVLNDARVTCMCLTEQPRNSLYVSRRNNHVRNGLKQLMYINLRENFSVPRVQQQRGENMWPLVSRHNVCLAFD